MNVEVELPDLGPNGGDHATISEWHFEEGEFVEEGETLLEVTCESGSIEVPAPVSGTLIERVVDEDDAVRVGETLAVMECQEETEEQISEEDEAAPIDE